MAKQETKDQSFREMYNSLPKPSQIPTPKQEFVTRIAKIVMKSETTVRIWLSDNSNGQQPSALEKDVLSKELGVPVEVLFPAKEEMEVEA